MLRDIGILGTGLWQGPAVSNDVFEPACLGHARPIDPFYGDPKAPIQVAGLELSPQRHPRAVAAVRHSYADPYRGARRRRWFPKGLPSSDAEADAGRAALASAGLYPQDVDALLLQSFLPDQLQPNNAALVAHKLGLCRGPAWDVNAVCSSSLAQLSVAAGLIASGQARVVLCVQSTAYSPVTDPASTASVVLGDMASAFVLGPRPGATLATRWHTDGQFYPAVQLRREDAPYWAATEEPVDIVFRHELMGAYLRATAEHAVGLCGAVLRASDLELSSVDLSVTHQAMSWFPAFIADAVGLRDGVMFDTFEEYASIGSCSIPASLHEARLRGRLGPGARVLLFVSAAGKTFGAAALRM